MHKKRGYALAIFVNLFSGWFFFFNIYDSGIGTEDVQYNLNVMVTKQNQCICFVP